MSAQRSTPENKLASFLRMLTSDNAGEVSNALGRITKLLKSPRLDLHAVADRVDGIAPPPDKAKMKAVFDHAYAKGLADGIQRGTTEARLPTSVRNVGNKETDRWHGIAVFCFQNQGRRRLGEREIGFITDMVNRTADGEELSERQANWLWDPYRRLGGQT